MRKSTIRHWVHGILDLLPLFVIPIFALFSINNDVTEDTVVVAEEPVYYDTNDVSTVDDFVVGNVYFWNDSYTTTPISSSLRYFNVKVLDGTYVNTIGNLFHDSNGNIYIKYESNGTQYILLNNNTLSFLLLNFDTNINSMPQSDLIHFVKCPYSFVKEYREVTTTYPNDVGTSYFNTLYNTVDKYFNMGNVFNMNDLYDWFVTNIFNGNAPASMFIVWNVVLYEFVMDLLMLLYALFMWFIDMAKRLIEKPLNSIK